VVTRSVGLNVEIDRFTRDLRKTYEKNFRRIRKLKDKMILLEQALGHEGGSNSAFYVRELNLTMRLLNRLSDSLIVTSRKASQELENLEQRCRNAGLEPSRLNDPRALCKKADLMAADLLCYTLGSLRRPIMRNSSPSLETHKSPF